VEDVFFEKQQCFNLLLHFYFHKFQLVKRTSKGKTNDGIQFIVDKKGNKTGVLID